MAINGTLLYTADTALTTATGTGKDFIVEEGQTLAYAQVYIEAGASGAVKVEIQGRLSDSASWVILDKQDHSTEASVTQSAGALTEVIFPIQLMPQMRVKHSGTYTATVGNDIRVWLLAAGEASRTDS